MDVKMDGDTILVPGGNVFFFFIYRTKIGNDSKRHDIKALYITADGRLYHSADLNERSFVGQLSNEEYSRIAISTDRMNNKYYVYFNDYLVNPDGNTLFSENDVETYQDFRNASGANDGSKYTAGNIPIAEARAYVISGNIEGGNNTHEGIYFDNIVYGRRFAYRPGSAAGEVLFQTDFSNAVDGDPVAPNTNRTNENWRETYSGYKSGWPVDPGAFGSDSKVGLAGVLDQNAVVYVDEDGDDKVDAVKWTYVPTRTGKFGNTNDDDQTDQAWLGLNPRTAIAKNFKLTMEIKGGENGTCSKTLVFFQDNNVSGNHSLLDTSTRTQGERHYIPLRAAELRFLFLTASTIS